MEIKIKQVHTLLDIVISVLVFAAGVGVYFVLPGWGILFCLIGVLLFVFYKRANKRVGESTLLKKKSLDISIDYREPLSTSLLGGGDIPSFELSGEGNHLYLEIFYNKGAKVAYAQLYEVADNQFDAVTDIVELRGAKAEQLIKML